MKTKIKNWLVILTVYIAAPWGLFNMRRSEVENFKEIFGNDQATD